MIMIIKFFIYFASLVCNAHLKVMIAETLIVLELIFEAVQFQMKMYLKTELNYLSLNYYKLNVSS